MEKQPLRKNGYLYSKGTAAGFLRLRRLGQPRPLFSAQDRLKKILSRKYNVILSAMLKDFLSMAQAEGVAKKQLTTDAASSFDELMDFFDQMAHEGDQAKSAVESADLKVKLSGAVAKLRDKWVNYHEDELPDDNLEHEMADILQACQENYLQDMMSDASPEFQNKLASFSLDKRELYNSIMQDIRQEYLDNCEARIAGEEDLIKRDFLQKIDDYITGASETLNIKSEVDALFERSKSMSQFFARDQLSRLNRATAMATYKTAEVVKVKWLTCGDVRVRESHKALNGKIFNINELPPEVDDYNCRCALVPYEYAN